MSSLRLKQLVAEVLAAIPTPEAEDVIEEVFVAIEANPVWRHTYDAVTYTMGKDVTAAWTGFWVSHLTQRVGGERETAARSDIIGSFARLDAPAGKRSKKVKEPEAIRAMHEHFLANRATLPAHVRDQRDVIVSLIMDGLPVEAAFATALDNPVFAWR